MRIAVLSALFIGIGTLAFLGCGDNSPEAPNSNGGSGGTSSQDADVPDIDLGDVDPGLETGGGNTLKPYPPSPYGYVAGTVIQNYKWLGWTNPAAVNYTGDLEPIELADFYDPDGSKGIKAIFINASARWCSVCKGEQKTIANQKAVYGPKGVVFLETLFEDLDQYPATPDDLAAWTKTYKIDWIAVVDPNNKLSPFFDTTATPMNMIIDAKTMTIASIVTGLPDATWWSTHLDPLTE